MIHDQVEELVALLVSPDALARAEAARRLVSMRHQAAVALPALLALCNDSWFLVRMQVPRAIMHMRARSPEATEILQNLLSDENEVVRLLCNRSQKSASGRELMDCQRRAKRERPNGTHVFSCAGGRRLLAPLARPHRRLQRKEMRLDIPLVFFLNSQNTVPATL